jgi:tetratricopeptide (TPR) repeat protein
MQVDLSLALQQHQRGCLDEAARMYQNILVVRPDDSEALHLLGVVAHQQGRHGQAIQIIGRAVALNPGRAAYHANLAEAFRAAGDLEQAASCGRIALSLRPDYPEAANNLGMALLQQGQIEAAIDQFRAALRLKPDFALACNNLGNALRLQGDQAGALAHFRQAVEIDPQLAEARCNLAQMLLENKQLQEALTHGQEAVRLRPTLAEAHSNLGNVLRELGRLDEAKACYAEALRHNPGLGMLYNNMAQALQEQGKLDDALAWYQRGLEVEPNLARLHGNLASALAEQERYEEAIACYQTAIGLDPSSAEAHNGLGWVLHEQGRYEAAQERYRTALRLKPDFAPAHANLGAVREELNDFAEAEHCFREALRHDPGQAGAWSQLASLLRGRLPDADLAAMRRLLADPDLTDAKRAALHFGLAQVLDARKDFAEAGEHLCRANPLALAEWRKRGQDYEPGRHTWFVDQLLATFTPEFFARVSNWGVETERPIFIVGLPRSGTTLVEQILARHSGVFGAGELPLAREDFVMLAADKAETGVELEAQVFEHLARLDAVTVSRLAARHLERLRALNERALRVADKMPDNYLYLGLLATMFPRAKFIHCRRDLRDVAVSCWITNFRAIRWTNDHDHIATRFQQYQRVMAHWRRVLPVPVLEVDYEETVADLEGVARRLVAWCGLQWEPGCLAFYEGKGPVRTASVVQVRQPIYTRSAGRWKNYESALGGLFARLEAETREPLAQAGSQNEGASEGGMQLISG